MKQEHLNDRQYWYVWLTFIVLLAMTAGVGIWALATGQL